MQLSRLAIGLVLLLNLQCAIQFISSPAIYAGGFGLTGLPGDMVIRGTGILFLMWNVPYIFAFANPVKYRTSYLQAILMQAIGFIGEFVLWSTVPANQIILRSSLFRFIVFDGAGLLLIIFGFLLLPQL
jgi:hypothetical protein